MDPAVKAGTPTAPLTSMLDSLDTVFDLTTSFWITRVLYAAVDLGVFSACRVPRTVPELMVNPGLHRRGAQDFLDALTSLGLLSRQGDAYVNGPLAQATLDPASPHCMTAMLERPAYETEGVWTELVAALRTGCGRACAAPGANFFAALYAEESALRRSTRAMTAFSRATALGVAREFDWYRYRTFLDVGCGEGILGIEAAARHGHLGGIGLDLPAVELVFTEHVCKRGLQGRIAFAGRDFFAEPLPHADVIMLSHILHDWSVSERRRLIAKAYDALAPGGALLICDAMIDDERTRTLPLLMSLNMLVETAEGGEYTVADCKEWLTDCGFIPETVAPLGRRDTMVVARR